MADVNWKLAVVLRRSTVLSWPMAASVSSTDVAGLEAWVLTTAAVWSSHRWNVPLPERTKQWSFENDMRPIVASNEMLGSSAPSAMHGKYASAQCVGSLTG